MKQQKNPLFYTFTPNPALDLGGIVDRVVPNEKNYVFSETRFAGGNGLNVARISHRLGARVKALGFLGSGIGEEIASLLDEEKVPNHFTRIEGSSRISLTISITASHEQTRFSFPGPQIKKNEIENFFREFSALPMPALFMLGGSLPQGFTPIYAKKLIRLLQRNDVPCWLDMPANDLKKLLSVSPTFIKPNLLEFQSLVGKKVSSLKNVVKEAQRLNQKIPIVCVSSVAGGAILSTEDCCWFGKIPKIKVKSTVGAGDSMVGAMAYQYIQSGLVGKNINSEEIGKLLRIGLAAACGTLSHNGTQLADKADVNHFLNKTEVKRIL